MCVGVCVCVCVCVCVGGGGNIRLYHLFNIRARY